MKSTKLTFETVIGKKLKYARIHCGLGFAGKGITQDDAAKKVGVTKAQISHYEKGTRMPSLQVFVKLCCLYGVDCGVILGVTKSIN